MAAKRSFFARLKWPLILLATLGAFVLWYGVAMDRFLAASRTTLVRLYQAEQQGQTESGLSTRFANDMATLREKFGPVQSFKIDRFGPDEALQMWHAEVKVKRGGTTYVEMIEGMPDRTDVAIQLPDGRVLIPDEVRRSTAKPNER